MAFTEEKWGWERYVKQWQQHLRHEKEQMQRFWVGNKQEDQCKNYWVRVEDHKRRWGLRDRQGLLFRFYSEALVRTLYFILWQEASRIKNKTNKTSFILKSLSDLKKICKDTVFPYTLHLVLASYITIIGITFFMVEWWISLENNSVAMWIRLKRQEW